MRIASAAAASFGAPGGLQRLVHRGGRASRRATIPCEQADDARARLANRGRPQVVGRGVGRGGDRQGGLQQR